MIIKDIYSNQQKVQVFLVKIFNDRKTAGSNIETMKAMLGLREQAMAKVTVTEGEGIGVWPSSLVKVN